ncbi:uncharacterized protein [Halyomorpha halys]|uniref:uncharacterized protein n=1 Tax=Halyomorpha halys TaxID=286706 RepID=UPI0006D51B0D|nr:uncharacterized protein LOC106679240 [Halyomorpha halys]
MDKILLPLLVVAASTSSVWCNSTRTPKLEILRSPTKVAVWKPDPYPILRSYGDELPAATVLTNSTSLPRNVTEEEVTKSENETISESSNSTAILNTTEINNSTKEEVLDSSLAKNNTCVRRDYEEDVAAVFKEEAGPLESASLVFNSTFQFLDGKISNVTELVNLRVLNETVVDCGAYLNLNETTETTTSTDIKT